MVRKMCACTSPAVARPAPSAATLPSRFRIFGGDRALRLIELRADRQRRVRQNPMQRLQVGRQGLKSMAKRIALQLCRLNSAIEFVYRGRHGADQFGIQRQIGDLRPPLTDVFASRQGQNAACPHEAADWSLWLPKRTLT